MWKDFVHRNGSQLAEGMEDTTGLTKSDFV